MMPAACIDCGTTFWRAHHETWKRLCIHCWRTRRLAAEPRQLPGTLAELPDRLRALTQLCHPDKHGGSALAVVTTRWLLELRRELRA